MTEEKAFDGSVKFNPRPKNEIDQRADRILSESRDAANRPPDKLSRHAEKAANCIIEKQNKGK